MKPVYRPPVWFHLYIAIIATLLASVLHPSCSTTGNTLSRWGGAAGGALAGGAVGGPVGAAVGAVAGDAGGDALVEDPPTTVNETRIENNGGTVNVSAIKAGSYRWYMDPWVWLAAYLVFRFRLGIVAFVGSLSTGGIKAAFMSLLGMVLGGKVADKAKEAVAMHAESRPRARMLRRLWPTPPATVVSSETKPHA